MRAQNRRWRLLLMPAEPTWWIWLITAVALVIGIVRYRSGFLVAIVISLAQTIYFFQKHGSLSPSPVQIRVAYTLLLIVCLHPGLRWLFWLPMIGTFALVLFGYCLMARFLSLLPWNRKEAISGKSLRHTFLSPPAIAETSGAPMSSCPGGVCSIEAQLGR